MPGNSQRKGAVRKKGKSTPAGSGGRVRRGLEGRGPTPKAEDRPYHKAYRKRRPEEPARTTGKAKSGGAPRKSSGAIGSDWVIGRNPVLEALQAGLPVKRGLIAEGVERDSRLRDILKLAAEQSVPLMQASRLELDRLTGGAVHQGIALQLPEFEYADSEDVLDDALDSETAPIVVACDSITDPRNLGAIIRSAAAFGAAGVLIPERRSAELTATAWKASAGAAARIPVAKVTNLNRTLVRYAEAGFTVIGLAGEGTGDLSAIDPEDPVLLVIGSEGDGLARLVRENCDVLARIPISSAVESLNASVAASIALYELGRDR